MDPTNISKAHQIRRIENISDIGETPEERISFLKHIQSIDLKGQLISQLGKLKDEAALYQDPELQVFKAFL